MISQFIKGRVYVFIDASKVFYTKRTLGWRIAYVKFEELLDRAKYIDLRKLKAEISQ